MFPTKKSDSIHHDVVGAGQVEDPVKLDSRGSNLQCEEQKESILENPILAK